MARGFLGAALLWFTWQGTCWNGETIPLVVLWINKDVWWCDLWSGWRWKSACSLSPFVFPLICSAGEMLDLLKWRAHPERINDSLSKLKDIDGSEIVKVGEMHSHKPVLWLVTEPANLFLPCCYWLTCMSVSCLIELGCCALQFLQDTLDTLFGILDESSQRYGLKVFDCLVSKKRQINKQTKRHKQHKRPPPFLSLSVLYRQIHFAVVICQALYKKYLCVSISSCGRD